MLDTLTKGEHGLGEGSSCPRRAPRRCASDRPRRGEGGGTGGTCLGSSKVGLGVQQGLAHVWLSDAARVGVASLTLPLSGRGVKLLQLLQSPSNFRCFASSGRSELVC